MLKDTEFQNDENNISVEEGSLASTLITDRLFPATPQSGENSGVQAEAPQLSTDDSYEVYCQQRQQESRGETKPGWILEQEREQEPALDEGQAQHRNPESEPEPESEPAEADTPNSVPPTDDSGSAPPPPPDFTILTDSPIPPRKKNKSGITGKMIAAMLVCALIGGAVGAGGAIACGNLWGGGGKTSNMLASTRDTSEISITNIDTSRLLSASEVYAQNVNSTVIIQSETVSSGWWGSYSGGEAVGSGFIITDDGYILTNYHVVSGSSGVTVTMYDGTEYSAKLAGYDQNTDIAILKIDAEGLTPVILGDSDTVQVGDDVVAIGNPMGDLAFSQTKGTISALDRDVEISSSSSSYLNQNGSVEMTLMQTDCAINSGNSGGPLFNMHGEVIGITNAKESGGLLSDTSVESIGFAIPINSVKSMVTSMIEKGYISKPYLGVNVSDVTYLEQQKYGLPQGTVISSVVENSPAHEAGLMQGDVVTAINGNEVTSANALVNAVGKCSPGDEIELSINRGNSEYRIRVVLGETRESAFGETQ